MLTFIFVSLVQKEGSKDMDRFSMLLSLLETEISIFVHLEEEERIGD